MWLPRDERRLLSYYYHRINKVNGEKSFDLKELVQALICKNIKELQQHEKEKRDKDIEEQVKDYINEKDRVSTANKALQSRGLIEQIVYSGGKVRRITLNLEGYDLGKKYRSLWLFIKLWYAEYIRNHPICVIVSFVSGILITLLSQWLLSKIIK